MVMFTCVYIFPPYQNFLLHGPPSHPAPTASKTPYPSPTNISQPSRHPRQPYKYWVVGSCQYRWIKLVDWAVPRISNINLASKAVFASPFHFYIISNSLFASTFHFYIISISLFASPFHFYIINISLFARTFHFYFINCQAVSFLYHFYFIICQPVSFLY